VNQTARAKESDQALAEKIVRHALIDRVAHWLMAGCVLILLVTAFFPILGVEFAWVTIHWVTGLVLVFSVLAHTLRSLLFKSLKSMWFGAADLRDVLSNLAWNLRRTNQPPSKPGKYSVAQKLIHHGFAAVVLMTMLTGCLMLAKIDTPWWERNPYFLGDFVWGIVYIVHDLSALTLITMVIAHVYFAFRPEKFQYLRAMLLGWITRQEYEDHHDADRWQVDK